MYENKSRRGEKVVVLVLCSVNHSKELGQIKHQYKQRNLHSTTISKQRIVTCSSLKNSLPWFPKFLRRVLHQCKLQMFLSLCLQGPLKL
jgi:hypothetical protein